MGSGTFYPAASGDDGYWQSNIAVYQGNAVAFGNTSGYLQHAWFRFANVTIPQEYSAVTWQV